MSHIHEDTLCLMPSDTPARRPRRTEAETRQRLLDLAMERLVDQGVGIGLDAIRMEKVIADAGVSRASAYRCWPHRDDFLADALVHTIRQTALLPEQPEDIARLVRLIEGADLLDEAARRDLVVEALRASVDADIRRLVASPHWRLFMALSTTVATIEDDTLRETVREELATMEESFVARRAEVYGGVCQMIGYRPTAPWSHEQGLVVLSQLAGLLMRGIASRALVDPGWLDERIPAALFGSRRTADWSQGEMALTGLVLGHLEPNPDVRWTTERLGQSRAPFDATAQSLAEGQL